jgi:hypothetical protein
MLTEDGAFTEPPGCNPSQPIAILRGPKTAEQAKTVAVG